MRLAIDADTCAGHGRCYELAPDLIDADDQGNGVVVVAQVAGVQLTPAERAVISCPERAVTLTEV